jgi:outer membrane protein assembly complex protein YaeT
VTPRIDAQAALANLVVAVVPGPRVRVVFAGDPLPGDERDRLVPIAAEGSADEDLLEDSSNRIQEYLRAQGYRDATAVYTRESGDDELRITFTVRRGPQYRVAAVELTGSVALPEAEIAPLVTLRAGQPFETARLEADAAAIQSVYRRQGYAAAAVEPAVEPQPRDGAAEVPVVVRLQISEGPRTLVTSVQFEGNRTIGDEPLSAGLGLAPGRPFFATQMALDRDAVQLKYADLGFHTAAVEASPRFSPAGDAVDVVFTINEGPQFVVDHVIIVGNDRIGRETIERELQVSPGNPLGLTAINDSQRRLAALGLFRRVRITQVGHGQETLRDVLVSVDEAPATTVAYGPGVEVVPRTRRTGADRVAEQTVEFAPRGFFEIGRRNLFGKNRSVNLFTRLSLRSRDSVQFDDDTDTPTTEASAFGFAEYRVLGTFREPRVFDWPADALLTAVAEQQSRSSFNFARRAFSADLIRRLTRFISITGNYQIQRTELFDEQINPEDRLLVDRLFPQVRLSSFSSSLVRDTRDDQLDPSVGTYMSANTQAAGRRIGSEVGLLKTYLTAQLFQSLPRTRGVVFATSGRVGMATAFTRQVTRLDAAGEPVIGADGQPVVDLLEDLPASERFFAGGDTTVRGFALDQLGTRDTIDVDGFPIGGNALLILNAELRVPIAGGLGAVGFFDTGNVFARTRAIDFGELRSAVGFGVRYQSPVGPIRVDIGFKLNPREIVPGYPESPRAVHISLGQAF